MQIQLTHVALHVRDHAACLGFYRDLCGMRVVHARQTSDDDPKHQVAWLALPGQEAGPVLVLLPEGPEKSRAAGDYSHLGFAVDSRAAVETMAERGRAAGCLLWEPKDLGPRVGYICGLSDPDGNAVEFSYGQPLGEGAPDGEGEGSDA